MVAVSFTLSKPDFRAARAERDRFRKNMHRASLEATDLAIQKARAHIQAKMKSVRLGKLTNAVGWTSAKRKRQVEEDRKPYGVIFARGGDESLAGGALEAYSQGTTITPERGRWLAVPTAAVPKTIGVGGRRRRLTPALWKQAGLESRIGKLYFVQVRSDLALLVVRNVSLSAKNGQAKMMGSRAPRTRIPKKQVTAFVLIRQTRRAKRFDKDEIMGFYVNRMPEYLARILAGYQRTA